MGEVRDKKIADAISVYTKRLPHYFPFSMDCLRDVKTTKGTTQQRQKEMEGEKFLAEIAPADFVVLLDERGKEFSSREFADFISRKSLDLPRNLILVIGGPYGFSQAVYSRADMLISLSRMTFPHELVRLFLAEQLYRAASINAGEPYHHD